MPNGRVNVKNAGRLWGGGITGLALAAIAVATLRASTNPTHTPLGCLLCGDTGGADATVNIILFVPLGVGAALLGLRLRTAVLAGLLTTVLVEAAQYTIVVGRDASLGDIVFNTAGTALGYGFTRLVAPLARLDDPLAARLGVGAALVFALIVAATGWLLQPSFPRSAYWGHWTPRLHQLEWFQGRVLSARIAGRDIPSVRIDDPDAVRSDLLAGGPIEVEYLGGPPVSGLASLFNVSDSLLRNIILVGPDRRDVVFQARTRAATFLLDQPDLRVRGGWTVPPGEPGFVRVSAPAPGVWCLEHTGTAQTCDGSTPGEGWTLLYYAEHFSSPHRWLLGAMWTAIAALPVGFLLRRRPEAAVALGLVAAAGLFLPGLVHLVAMPANEWIGVALGLGSGAVARAVIRRHAAPG
jgi:hypothetical protein